MPGKGRVEQGGARYGHVGALLAACRPPPPSRAKPARRAQHASRAGLPSHANRASHAACASLSCSEPTVAHSAVTVGTLAVVFVPAPWTPEAITQARVQRLRVSLRQWGLLLPAPGSTERSLTFLFQRNAFACLFADGAPVGHGGKACRGGPWEPAWRVGRTICGTHGGW